VAVDAMAQRDQAALIAHFGGPDAAHTIGSSTATPVQTGTSQETTA
jgi:choline-sulfatase